MKVRMKRPEAAGRLAGLALESIREAFRSHETDVLMLLSRDRLLAGARDCDKSGFCFTEVTKM